MTIRDGLGNRISEGNLLFWPRVGVTAKVVRVNEGGLSIVGHDHDALTEPSLVVEVIIGVNMQGVPKGQEPQLAEFIRVVDPKSEGILDSAMGRKPQ